MNSKKSCVCACCGCRLTQNGRRPVTDKCLRLFVTTSVIPSYLPNDGHTCSKCPAIYNKSKALPKFHDMLTMLNDGHEATNTTIEDILSEATSDGERMDRENCNDRLANETSRDDELMNEDLSDAQTVGTSSSDDQSIDDANSDDHVKDEAMSPDRSSEEVSCSKFAMIFLSYFQDDTMVTDNDADEHTIKISVEIGVSSKR